MAVYTERIHVTGLGGRGQIEKKSPVLAFVRTYFKLVRVILRNHKFCDIPHSLVSENFQIKVRTQNSLFFYQLYFVKCYAIGQDNRINGQNLCPLHPGLHRDHWMNSGVLSTSRPLVRVNHETTCVSHLYSQ